MVASYSCHRSLWLLQSTILLLKLFPTEYFRDKDLECSLTFDWEYDLVKSIKESGASTSVNEVQVPFGKIYQRG